jgi:hypothetical protein
MRCRGRGERCLGARGWAGGNPLEWRQHCDVANARGSIRRVRRVYIQASVHCVFLCFDLTKCLAFAWSLVKRVRHSNPAEKIAV